LPSLLALPLTLTYDLEFQSPASYGDDTHTQYQGQSQAVQKLERKSTDGRTRPIALLSSLIRLAVKFDCSAVKARLRSDYGQVSHTILSLTPCIVGYGCCNKTKAKTKTAEFRSRAVSRTTRLLFVGRELRQAGARCAANFRHPVPRSVSTNVSGLITHQPQPLRHHESLRQSTSHLV